MPEYIVPAATLNTARGEYLPIQSSDVTHPIPDDWLKANAARFYFTDEQILAAAVAEFHAPNLPGYARCFGIYFLICKGKIVYVGMSTNIAARIARHRKNEVGFDSLAWFEAPELYLKNIEAYYIRRIDPWLNLDKPGHTYFLQCVQELKPAQIEDAAPSKLVDRIKKAAKPQLPKKPNASTKRWAEHWARLAADVKASHETTV